MSDYIELEMRMASLMAQQETSGFRFDLEAAERVKADLQEEMGHRCIWAYCYGFALQLGAMGVQVAGGVHLPHAWRSKRQVRWVRR